MQSTTYDLNHPDVMTPLVRRILDQIGDTCVLDKSTGVATYSLPNQKHNLTVQVEEDTYLITGAFVMDPFEGIVGPPRFVLVGYSQGFMGIFAPLDQVTELVLGNYGALNIEAITADQIHLSLPLP